jgi:hypothetical protein
MASVLLIASLLLAWYSLSHQRAMARRSCSETVYAKFLDHLFEWSVSLAAVLIFYHILLALLASGWRWITVGDLERLELSLGSAQIVINRYKPTWTTWMVVLVVFYLVGRMWIGFLANDTPYRVFKKTRRLLHCLNTLVFLMASFTLLGFEPGKAASTLEINLRKERTDYGLLRRNIESALAAATINRAYDNLAKSLPHGVDVANLAYELRQEELRLRSTYAEIQTKYNSGDERISRLVNRFEVRQGAVDKAIRETEQHTTSAPIGGEEIELPGTLTYEDLSRANGHVKELQEKFRPRVLRLLEEPGAKEIVLKLPEGPIDHLFETLSPIVEANPMVKPIFDILRNTLNDAIEQAFRRKINNLTDSFIEHPEEVDTELPREAEELADSQPIKATLETKRQLQHSFDELSHELTEIRSSTRRLEQEEQAIEARGSKINRNGERAFIDAAAGTRRTRETEDAPSARIDSPSKVPDLSAPEPFNVPNSTNVPEPSTGSTLSGCTCQEYVNGMLVSTTEIPVGAMCGPYSCGSNGLHK